MVGDAGLDVVVRTPALPAPGGDARARIAEGVGGAGANTAAWLAACGASPVLVSRVGDDAAADRVRSSLAAAGVQCAFAVDPVAPTCRVVVVVDDTGQRTMLADRGAAGLLSPTDVRLAGAVHLHLSGYVLLDPSSAPAGVAALARARAAGITTSVDPQAAALLADPGPFLAAVAGVDLLLPSAGELATLGTAESLLDVVGAVAVTSDVSGATWVDRRGRVTVPSEPAEVVDSTGAGDAFDAGLLTAWLAGAPPAEALRAGVRAGARAVARPGARPPRPGADIPPGAGGRPGPDADGSSRAGASGSPPAAAGGPPGAGTDRPGAGAGDPPGAGGRGAGRRCGRAAAGPWVGSGP
ncbi:MAG TPA: PfkB family carbohydrate kinase [Mycobacteriales bacterium]